MRYMPISIGVDTTEIDNRLDALELMILQNRLMSNRVALHNEGRLMNSDGNVVPWSDDVKAQIEAEIVEMKERIAELS